MSMPVLLELVKVVEASSPIVLPKRITESCLIVVALWVFWPYSMTGARHATITAELEERRAHAD